MAEAFEFDPDWSSAEGEIRKGLALDPGDASALRAYSSYLVKTGRLEQALTESRAALDLDPLSPWAETAVARVLYDLRRTNEAIAHFHQALALDPEMGGASQGLAVALLAAGKNEEAVAEAEKARRKVSGYTLPRPNLISLVRVTNLRVQDITLQNSPKFHLVPSDCTGVVISNTTIRAPEHAANTDAIDPSSCRQVLITHCTIDVGDDTVAIKAGRAPAGREFACEDITVTDCTFRHGHGMSIGSETGGGVRNVLVKNCTFENTENGLRIKSQIGRGGRVENIRYEHISMTNVDPAITFTMYYMNNSAKDAAAGIPTQAAPARMAENNVPSYGTIYITDLQATCPRAAGVINGLPESCVSNVVFENVTITSAKGFQITNARGIQFKQALIAPKQGPPFILTNAQTDGVAPATN